MTEKQRAEEIRAFVNLCLSTFEDTPFVEVARQCDLSVATIYRLWHTGGSPYMRAGTLWKLGDAAGYRLTSDLKLEVL